MRTPRMVIGASFLHCGRSSVNYFFFATTYNDGLIFCLNIAGPEVEFPMLQRP